MSNAMNHIDGPERRALTAIWQNAMGIQAADGLSVSDYLRQTAQKHIDGILSFDELSRTQPGESSAAIRKRVIAARQIQEERYREHPGIHCNAQMTSALMRQYATPAPEDLAMLREVINRLKLSARAYDRILRLARTIADLEASPTIQTHHLAEAVGYRNLDRESWGE